MPELEEKRVEGRKTNLINWIKEYKFLVFLVLILLVGLILRFKYSILEAPEAEWWDSADYMSTAKALASNDFKENITQFGINTRRPFLLPLIWAGILYFNGNETGMHITILILSLLAVYFTYLLGKKLFNENTGLIAALMMAVSWLHLFFTARLLTDVPAMAFWLVSGYFFWRGYIMEEGNKYVWYAAIFFGLSIFTRAASIINIIPILLLMIIKERHKFLVSKKLWVSFLLILVVMSPFIIWLYANFDNPIEKFTGLGGGEKRFRAAQGGFKFTDLFDVWKNLNYISRSLLGPTITGFFGKLGLSENLSGFLIVIAMILLCIEAILGIDIVFKERNKELIKKIYLLIWFLTPYLFYSIFNPGVEDRYLFAMFPVFFVLASDALLKLNDKLKKYWEYLGVILLIILFAVFVYFNIKDADSAHESRRYSYAEVAKAGKWIKENSEATDRVISASKYQNMYYSERDTFPFCDNDECRQNETYFLNKRLREINPKYVIISIYERGFTPEWAYKIAQKYPSLFVPVQAYGPNQQNTYLLVIEYKERK